VKFLVLQEEVSQQKMYLVFYLLICPEKPTKRTSGHTVTNASCPTSTMAEYVAENIASDTSPESETENGEDMNFTSDNSSDSDAEADSAKSTHEELQMTEGDHVIMLYEGRQYPGKMKQLKKLRAQVTCMESSGSNWKWLKELMSCTIISQI